VGGDAPVARAAHHGEVPLAVGAVDAHPVAVEQPQRVGGGVAVVVGGAHRDQRDPRAGGGQEVRVHVGAAVVRDLEHVGTQVDAAVEDARLGLGAEIAGEQHP